MDIKYFPPYVWTIFLGKNTDYTLTKWMGCIICKHCARESTLYDGFHLISMNILLYDKLLLCFCTALKSRLFVKAPSYLWESCSDNNQSTSTTVWPFGAINSCVTECQHWWPGRTNVSKSVSVSHLLLYSILLLTFQFSRRSYLQKQYEPRSSYSLVMKID